MKVPMGIALNLGSRTTGGEQHPTEAFAWSPSAIFAANETYNGVRCERATAARREFHSGDRAESPHRGEEARDAPSGWPGAKVSERGERRACCPAPPGHSTIATTERKVG